MPKRAPPIPPAIGMVSNVPVIGYNSSINAARAANPIMAAAPQTTKGKIAVSKPVPAIRFHFLRASVSAGLSLIGLRGTARY